MDIGQLLESAILNPDQQLRAQAEARLEELAKDRFLEYLGLLTEALANESQKTEVRMLAGIALKNQLTAKDSKTKSAQIERWLAIGENERTQIKSTALQALLTPDDRVASSAAQLVAAIADIDLPRNLWPELIPTIVENTKTEKPVHVKRASLLTIGYICETADPSNPGIINQSNGILTAIVQGAQNSEESIVVRLTAINALVNSLEFIRYNFEREGERNYIMQVVCEATQSSDVELQAASFGALARIMSLYYPYMGLYMERALYGLTVNGMRSENEEVACMAVEFWSTVCEEEIDISLQLAELEVNGGKPNDIDNDLNNFNFALTAITDVLPTLLNLLTRQNEDPFDDDWSVSMASGCCLQLFAQNTGNFVVQPTLEFVEKSIGSENWRLREAAVMAFGSILDGPDHDQLKTLIGQALGPILQLIKDSTLQVEDTVAWCLGRIADLVIDGIDIDTHLPLIIEAITLGMNDHPKVSTNCCWTLMNLVEQLCQDGPQQDTTPMSRYYESLVPLLMQLTNKNDNEYSSRASAYEALSTLVIFSADDVSSIVLSISNEILLRLEQTLKLQAEIVNSDDKATLEELQTNILSLLTNIIRRADSQVVGASDQLMQLFLSLLSNKVSNSLIEEDIFIAISSVSGAVGEEFIKYMDAFIPFLHASLQEPEHQACTTAVGLVADISHALGEKMSPYVKDIMALLAGILSNENARRDVRPSVVSCFGDLASSIGPEFQPYLEGVFTLLQQASNVNIESEPTIENLDYFLSLRESVLDAYVGIIAGLHSQPNMILQYIESIFQFLLLIHDDVNMTISEHVCRSVVGLLGDIAQMYPDGSVKEAYKQSWVTSFIRKTRSNGQFKKVTKDTARWAREMQKRQLDL